MLTTFLLAVIGWVIFRANSLTEAGWYLWDMVTKFRVSFSFIGKAALVYILIFIVVEWVQSEKEHPLQIDGLFFFKSPISRWFVYILLSDMLFLLSADQQDFIYFQF
jgi:hypothetical protein